MLSTINYLLRNDQYEEAIDILDEMGVVIASNDVAHIQYSNYPLLDAVLQEFANRCLGSNIEFSGVLYWDENIRLDELTIVRVFTNLLTNAYEACLEVDEEKRFIKLESKLRDYWLDIRISNSYSGMIHEDLSSTKDQSHRSRGLGTKIVHHTIEELVVYSPGILRMKLSMYIFISLENKKGHSSSEALILNKDEVVFVSNVLL